VSGRRGAKRSERFTVLSGVRGRDPRSTRPARGREGEGAFGTQPQDPRAGHAQRMDEEPQLPHGPASSFFVAGQLPLNQQGRSTARLLRAWRRLLHHCNQTHEGPHTLPQVGRVPWTQGHSKDVYDKGADRTDRVVARTASRSQLATANVRKK